MNPKKKKTTTTNRFSSDEEFDVTKIPAFSIPKLFYKQTIDKEYLTIRKLSNYGVKLVNTQGESVESFGIHDDISIRKNLRVIHADEEFSSNIKFVGLEIEHSMNENIWSLRRVKWTLDNMIEYKFDEYVGLKFITYTALEFKMKNHLPEGQEVDQLQVLRNYIIYNCIATFNKTCPLLFKPAHEDASGVEVALLPCSHKALLSLQPEIDIILKTFNKFGLIPTVEHTAIHTHLSHSIFGENREEQRDGLRYFLWFLFYNNYSMSELSNRRFKSSIFADLRYLVAKDAAILMNDMAFKDAFIALKDEVIDGFFENKHVNSNLNVIVNREVRSTTVDKINLDSIEYRWWAATGFTPIVIAYAEFFYAMGEHIRENTRVFHYSENYNMSAFYRYLYNNKEKFKYILQFIDDKFPLND